LTGNAGSLEERHNVPTVSWLATSSKRILQNVPNGSFQRIRPFIFSPSMIGRIYQRRSACGNAHEAANRLSRSLKLLSAFTLGLPLRTQFFPHQTGRAGRPVFVRSGRRRVARRTLNPPTDNPKSAARHRSLKLRILRGARR